MSLPPGMTRFALVLLRSAPDRAEIPAEADAIQERHLAHLQALREAGALLAAGPFRDQRDESLRGLCVFGVALEEAAALMAADPAVQAGRLVAEPLHWWVRESDLPLERPAGDVRSG